MANIRKRGNSYQIRVSCGYTSDMGQVTQSMTWTPTAGMTDRQIEKAVQRQAVLFEEACLKGQVTSAMKFEDFCRRWFKEYAEVKLKTNTIRGYHDLEPRAYKNGFRPAFVKLL